MTTYEEQISDFRAKIDAYAAKLRRPSEDYSRVLPHVPPKALAAVGLPVIEARVNLAELRLRFELRGELLRTGMVASEAQLDDLIAAIPREDYYRLLAART